jgi:hypothetical protein
MLSKLNIYVELDLLGLFNRQQVGSDLISGAFETRHIPRGRESDIVTYSSLNLYARTWKHELSI